MIPFCNKNKKLIYHSTDFYIMSMNSITMSTKEWVCFSEISPSEGCGLNFHGRYSTFEEAAQVAKKLSTHSHKVYVKKLVPETEQPKTLMDDMLSKAFNHKWQN
jgi:hypothetical protein